METLKRNQTWKASVRPWELSGPAQIQAFLDMKYFARVGRDKQGRPNVFLKLSRFYPDRITADQFIRGCWKFEDYLRELMPENVD